MQQPETSNNPSHFTYQTGVALNDLQSVTHTQSGFQSYATNEGNDSYNLMKQQELSNFPTQYRDANDQSTTGTSPSSTSSFPNLVVYLSNNPKEKLAILKQSFAESPYGQLDTVTQQFANTITVSLVCAGKYLAEGSAKTLKEATIIAACSLIEKLQATNYTIVENSNYFSNKKVPHCVLNVDPSLKYIYRVVYLEKKSWFPLSVTGAVDYVHTEDELWKYIKDHCKNQQKVDLFILNIEKSHRRRVSEISKAYNMNFRKLNGCSDRGAAIMAKLDLSSLFHELKECGGKHLKYELIPPGNPIQNESKNVVIKTEDAQNTTTAGIVVPGKSKNNKDVFNEGEEVVISKWIADNLIIMDVFNKNSVKESPKEILFFSVKYATAFNEFIIEKTRNRFTGKITASALIDRKLVGGATGYTEQTVKILAAENALENLKNYCYYIEGKPSYFGINGCRPTFLFHNYPRNSSSLYRILGLHEAYSSEEELSYTLKQFKSSDFEDLFILTNIPYEVRNLACTVAVRLKLLVRWFEEQCVCIYKSRRPREVLGLLLSLDGRENEKYRLHEPLKKPECNSRESSKSCTADIPKLFDFKTETSQGPVYYDRSQKEESYSRKHQKHQGMKRDFSHLDDYRGPSGSNKHWGRGDRDRCEPHFN